MTCAEARAALGVDVLGALDHAESAALHEHVASCPDCQAAQAELAGTPALLGLVSAEEVDQGFPHPDERTLQRLQDRVRSERARERRGRWRTVLAAAAVVVVFVGAGGWAIGRWVTPNLPATGPHTTAPPVEWAATNPSSQISAVVTLNPVPWGTKVDVELQGVKKGDLCSLVVYDRSGRKWDGGSWTVAYDGGVTWSGGVAVPADSVARIEISAPGSRKLVELEG